MATTTTRLTEDVRIETARGAAIRVGDGVTIEYRPEALPFDVGHAILTGGRIERRPVNGRMGRIVVFVERFRDKTLSITVTPDRPGLAELADAAERLGDQVEAARKARWEQPDRSDPRLAEWIAGLPAGHVALDGVEYSATAADGDGLTTYRHLGHRLSDAEVESIGGRELALGSYSKAVYVDGGKLDALIAAKRAAEGGRTSMPASRVCPKCGSYCQGDCQAAG